MKIFFLSLLLLCGCAAPRQPIQFGFFQVPQKNLPAVRELGVDFVVAGKIPSDYLDQAASLNLKIITADPKVKHPAVVGSILTDEPDLHGISPTQISSEYKAAKRHTRKPIFLNLSSGYSAESYAENCDVLMFDWFPVNWTPTETFFSQLRAARLIAGKKPFYAVVQNFDWSKYPELMPPGPYRKPTPAEIKAMTIWAAMNGASGIAYYPFDDRHFSLNEAPEISAAIKESIALVRNYDWLFESPRAWIDYPFAFNNRMDQTNSVSETSIAIRAARSKDQPNTIFVVAANTTDHAITVKPRGQIIFDEAIGEIRFEALEVKFLTGRGGGWK